MEQMMEMAAPEPRKVLVKHGGEEVLTDEISWEKAADDLVAKHGAGAGNVPKVVFVDSLGNEEEAAPATDPEASPDPVKKGAPQTHEESMALGVDEEGAKRSEEAHQAAIEAGFSPAQPYYARGTRVIELGVDNARRSRMEFEQRPTVAEMAKDFVGQIESEQRRDVIVRGSDMRMNESGVLRNTVPISSEGANAYLLTTHAFPGFANRMGYGGASYLQKCYAELRAHNVNEWAKRISGEEDEALKKARAAEKDPEKRSELTTPSLVLRTRRNPRIHVPEVFGVVSESYTSFDVDKVARALDMSMPEGARADVTYDGYRAQFNVMFHSNVQPEKYVAGEFFRAGIQIKTDDTGGGSCIGGSYVEQNLCLNLLCIDFADQPLFRIRHIGTVEELAKKFGDGMKQALKQLEYFLKQWGYAQEEDILRRAHETQPDDDVPQTISQAIPGFFTGILERELVPVRGRKVDAVPKLMKYWSEDASAAPLNSRARIVNAFTAYAHKEDQPDPFVEDEIQRAAGALLYGERSTSGTRKAPKPLPWTPPEK